VTAEGRVDERVSDHLATLARVDGGRPAGTRFVRDEADGRLEAQMRQADALDGKAAALVGFHVVAVGVLASLAAHLAGGNRWVGLVIIVGLMASGWLALAAFRSEAYDRRPAPEELWRFADWAEDDIQLRFLSTRFAAIEANRKKLGRKARAVSGSIAILAVLAFVLGVTAAVEIAI